MSLVDGGAPTCAGAERPMLSFRNRGVGIEKPSGTSRRFPMLARAALLGFAGYLTR